MVITSSVSVLLKPNIKISDNKPNTNLESQVPIEFSNWRVDESILPVLPDPTVQSKLDLIYTQTLSRTYINNLGQRVMLSIAYGREQRDGLRLHRPEVCYTSNGFSVSQKTSKILNIDSDISLPVIQMRAVNGSRSEPITYWVVVGKRVLNKKFDRKLEQMRYSMRGIVPDAYLIRISSLGMDCEFEYKIHKHFITDMLHGMGEGVRRIFIGGLSK